MSATSRYRHKIKPDADALREQLKAIPVLGAAEMKFRPNGFVPGARFYRWTGDKLGRVFSVRVHKGKTFVFRLE